MKHAILTAITVVAVAAGAAAQTGEIRLIIQGDDMGAAHGINMGTITAYREGILRVTNVIMPGGWVPEAAQLLRENPGLDVGVHLALTSEWSRVKWRPLTDAPSLVDLNGYFFPMVWPNKNFPAGSSMREAKIDTGEVEKELRAQIELARKLMPQVTYMSTHMGFSSLSPEVRAVVEKLAQEYKLPVNPGKELGIQYLGNVWTSRDGGPERADKLAARLSSIGPGTWLMVEHAALDTPETQAMGHPGYENVAADRSAVLEAWTSPKVLAVVKQRGIKLVSYRDVLPR